MHFIIRFSTRLEFHRKYYCSIFFACRSFFQLQMRIFHQKFHSNLENVIRNISRFFSLTASTSSQQSSEDISSETIQLIFIISLFANHALCPTLRLCQPEICRNAVELSRCCRCATSAASTFFHTYFTFEANEPEKKKKNGFVLTKRVAFWHPSYDAFHSSARHCHHIDDIVRVRPKYLSANFDLQVNFSTKTLCIIPSVIVWQISRCIASE